jgi:hypothetical protein
MADQPISATQIVQLVNARILAPRGLLRQADQVGENAIRARNALGQLPVKCVRVVHVQPFAVLGVERPALLRFLAFVVSLQKRGIARVPGDARNCTTYDRWPYGMQGRSGYTAQIPDDQLKKQLASRSVTYLLGEIDILPLGGFDSSCPAMAQGPTRLARGQSFAKYVNQKYGAKHQVTVVPLCGHNSRCMFTADPALPILFPEP